VVKFGIHYERWVDASGFTKVRYCLETPWGLFDHSPSGFKVWQMRMMEDEETLQDLKDLEDRLVSGG
jgi:hypothetical protein